MRRAKLHDYLDWINGYLARGKKPTHLYEYPFENQDRWFVADKNFRTGGERGSFAAHIIVLPGVNHIGGELGHNNFFFVEGFDNVGSWVPVYNNAEFSKLGLEEWIIEQREREEKLKLCMGLIDGRSVYKIINSDIPPL